MIRDMVDTLGEDHMCWAAVYLVTRIDCKVGSQLAAFVAGWNLCDQRAALVGLDVFEGVGVFVVQHER